MSHLIEEATQPIDAPVREQVLDITKSFAVTAPAGSGKTELLTCRFLNLLATCEEPEEILCITFTRKAADEMRQRIIKSLESALNEAPSNNHKAQTWLLAKKALQNAHQRNWLLLENSNRLQIMTIDSLCQKLSNSMGLESLLGVTPQAVDNAEILYTQAARNTLGRLESDGKLRPALSDFLLHLDNDHGNAEKLIVQLLGKREQWLPHLLTARQQRESLQQNIVQLVTQAIQSTHALLQVYSDQILPLVRFAADNLREHSNHKTLLLTDINHLPEISADALPQWRALADFFLTNDGAWRLAAGINVKRGFPADKGDSKLYKEAFISLLNDLNVRDDILENLKTIVTLPDAKYADKQWITLEHITHVMLNATAELKLIFGSQQQSDFTEIALGALRALGDEENPTDLALRLDYRIMHILVDEFQDTAKPQYDLLARLTRGWQSGDGRTLFVVGDCMQSCYGFREANVGIFMKARTHGIGNVHLEPVFLSVNFRSQENIVNWVNHTFKKAFPKTEDLNTGATCYYESSAAHPPLEGAAVSCYGFVYQAGQEKEQEQIQAKNIVEIIQSLRDKSPNDSIAILVRSRKTLTHITPALRDANITWQANEIEPLAKKMGVLDALTLTRALLSITDEMSWMALLRTPWFGLDNADLLALAQHRKKHDQTLWQSICSWNEVECLTPDAQTILARAVPVLQASMANTHRKTLRQRVQGTWLSLGGEDGLQQPHDYGEVMRFFDLLERHEKGGAIVDTSLFQQALNKLYAAPVSTSNTENAVQIMTMHKSKGLQFDHVILPSLGKKSGKNDSALLLWHEHIQSIEDNSNHHEERLLIDVMPDHTDVDNNSAITLYSYLNHLKKTRDSNEVLRVLYVACTRAIKSLHLLGAVTAKKNGELEAEQKTMLASIFPSFCSAVSQWQHCIRKSENDFENESDDTQANITDIKLTRLKRLPVSWLPTPVPPDKLMANWRGIEFDEILAPDDGVNPLNRPAVETQANRTTRVTGILLHRLLCRITEEGIHHWPFSRIQRHKPLWHSQLLAQGLAQQEASLQSALVAKALQNTLSDERGLWLLDNRHTNSACELSLSDASRTHVIDRTFIHDNTRWIIDYKTASPEPNESIQDFLQRKMTDYKPQLLRYRAIFASLESTPVCCALYFPLAGLWIEM